MAKYLLNSWYVAAWTPEVTSERLLARTLLDRPVALYRTAAGEPVALHDRCPHRFAPLSQGEIVDDAVTCPYHGLTFDKSGGCLRSPFLDRIPPNAKVQSYPVVDRYGAIWIWMGEAALADADLIPDFSTLDERETFRGLLPVKCNYELITDNLMDLSHVELVHRGTFAVGSFFLGDHAVREEGDAIWSEWHMMNIARPSWAEFLPAEGQYDHWVDMRWHAPSNMVQLTGIVPAGATPTAQHSQYGCHFVTPETATTSHYFYTYDNNVALVDGQEDIVTRAFLDEDKPMLEAVQERMGDQDFWSLKPVILNLDAAAIRVRQRLRGLIADEEKASAARPSQVAAT